MVGQCFVGFLGSWLHECNVLFCSNGILYVQCEIYCNMMFAFAPHVHRLQIILYLPSTSSLWTVVLNEFNGWITVHDFHSVIYRSLNCPVNFRTWPSTVAKLAPKIPRSRVAKWPGTGTPFRIVIVVGLVVFFFVLALRKLLKGFGLCQFNSTWLNHIFNPLVPY